MIEFLLMITIIGFLVLVVLFFGSSLVVSLVDKLFNDKKGGESK